MNIVEGYDVSTMWACMVGGCAKKNFPCFVVIRFGVSGHLTAVECNPHSLSHSLVQAEPCVPNVQKGRDSTRELCMYIMHDPWPRFFVLFPPFFCHQVRAGFQSASISLPMMWQIVCGKILIGSCAHRQEEIEKIPTILVVLGFSCGRVHIGDTCS